MQPVHLVHVVQVCCWALSAGNMTGSARKLTKSAVSCFQCAAAFAPWLRATSLNPQVLRRRARCRLGWTPHWTRKAMRKVMTMRLKRLLLQMRSCQ